MDTSWLSCPSYPGYASTVDPVYCSTAPHAHPIYSSPTDCAPYDPLGSELMNDLPGLDDQTYAYSAYESSHEATGSIRSTSSPTSFSVASVTRSPAVIAQQPYGAVALATTSDLPCISPRAMEEPRSQTHFLSKLQQVSGRPFVAQAQDHSQYVHTRRHNGHLMQAHGAPHPTWHAPPPSGWCALPIQPPFINTDQTYQHLGPAYRPLPVPNIGASGQVPLHETQGRVWEVSESDELNSSAFPAADTPSFSMSATPPLDGEDADADVAAQLAYDDEEELAIGRECINTREHRIFQPNTKDEEGFYHCPFAHKGKCGHTPKSLKCDFYKMVEAHIKQYRCMKSTACITPMTSRAIRFRHEREQHDVVKYLCTEPSCQRGQEKYGFPRAYNRDDHMKRQHGRAPTPDDEDQHEPVKAGRRAKKDKYERKKKHTRQKLKSERKRHAASDAKASGPSKAKAIASSPTNTAPMKLVRASAAASLPIAPAPRASAAKDTAPMKSNAASITGQDYEGDYRRWSIQHTLVTNTLAQIKHVGFVPAMFKLAGQTQMLADMSQRIYELYAPERVTRT